MLKLTRREALKLGLLGGGSLLFPWEFAQPAFAQFSPQIKRFQLSFQTPPELKPVRSDATTDYYEITVKKCDPDILPGLETEIWGYNGISPGPTIRQFGGAVKDGGRLSVVRFINKLDKNIQGKNDCKNIKGRDNCLTTHLHGMASFPQYDGYAIDYIPPDYFKDYQYPNDRAGTLWYHDHAMDYTSNDVYYGLAGMYIVQDKYELDLPLPRGEYDVPLILQDKQFAADGSAVFDNRNAQGLYGDVMLVNGVPWPKMEVANRKYRFRILNASVSRNYELVLSHKEDGQTIGDQLIVIGSDAGLLSEPVFLKAPSQTLWIGMAERYEVIIDFSKYPINSQLFLRNVDFQETVNKDARGNILMRFDVVRQEKDDSEIPNKLRFVKPILPSSAVRTRTFRFDRNNGQWKINNQVWDPKRVDANPNPGDIEIWNLVNSGGGWMHPVHIHFVDLQMLDRNGVLPRPYERGWKDVFHVGEWETVRVITKFGNRENDHIQGKYMMHCHNLVHEDHAMMTQFEIGKGGVEPTAAPAKPISEMLPL